MSDLDAMRHQLAVLARRKSARVLGWPRDWRPGEVRNPHDGQPFTGPGAWEYLAELLDAGHEIEVITLDEPPGATGYVLQVPIEARNLYIKVQLGAGKIIGRSFHYSVYD